MLSLYYLHSLISCTPVSPHLYATLKEADIGLTSDPLKKKTFPNDRGSLFSWTLLFMVFQLTKKKKHLPVFVNYKHTGDKHIYDVEKLFQYIIDNVFSVL